jgi:hypothetical protein
VRSLFKCRASVPFTDALAKTAVCDRLAVADAVKEHLLRHAVSPSTQASSTLRALETLGVVTVGGSRKEPVYTLTNAPITKQLEKMLAA